VDIDPIASGLNCRVCFYLRSVAKVGILHSHRREILKSYTAHCKVFTIITEIPRANITYRMCSRRDLNSEPNVQAASIQVGIFKLYINIC
jgi:hypothetical protein